LLTLDVEPRPKVAKGDRGPLFDILAIEAGALAGVCGEVFGNGRSILRKLSPRIQNYELNMGREYNLPRILSKSQKA